MSTKKFTIIASVLFALSVVVTPVFAACSLQTPAECDNAGLLQLIAQLGAGGTTTTTTTTTTTGSISGIPAGFQFTQTLKQGSTGIQVKYLQILLNSDSATAVGNAGAETSYFGALTKAAVNKFQAKYAAEILTPLGLTAPTGNWAGGTRAKANAILAAGGTGTPTGNLPAGCTSTAGYSSTTGQSCATGTGSTLPAGCTTTSGFSPVTGQSCASGTTVPATGGFAVRLAADNPASGTLVTGQATGDLAHYTFSNGTGTAVNVTGIELTRIGVSADATLANVYLFNGATRVTDAGTVSSGKVNFNAVNGLFSVPANSTITISVKSDITAGTQGQQIGISLSGVTSNGTLVNTTLPIAGNIFNIAQANLATVVIQNVLPGVGGTTTDPTTSVMVWQANLLVGVNNVNFTKLALKQINSISATDISNFKLQIDGVEVATVASLDANNYVTFTLDKVLNTGTRNVKVLADVTGGSSRIIQLSLRNRADIDVKDAQYGVNVSATGVPATTGIITVNPGNITVAINNSSLPVTVANSASNVLIGKYTFKAAGEAIRVDNLNVGFNTTVALGGVPTLRNAKVMINGSQAGSTTNLGLSATGGTAFAVNYTFQPGVATTVEIYADIFNNGTGAAIGLGNSISTTILAPGVGAGAALPNNGTRQISLGLIGVPSTVQTGAGVTVGAASSTLTMTSGFTNQVTVVPQTAYKIGSWTMKAGTAEDINVNTLSFATAVVTDAAGGNQFTVADMANMYVVYKVGSGAAVTTSTTTTPATPQAFSVSFPLPRTQTATIELYADLLAGAVDAGDSVRATLTVTGTGSQSGLNAAIAAAPGQVITAQIGNIVVTRDASTPNAALVAQNNTVSSVAYKFAASNDSFDVTQLSFSINDPSAVIQANLMEGTTVLASTSPAQVITFNGFSTPITINANQSKTLTLQLVLGAIGTGAGNTGANVTSDFIGGPASAASLLRPASTGIATGPTYTDNPGNAIFVYQAVPTITLVSLPSGTLAAGSNTIAKFQVGTTGGTISWKALQFSVAKTAGGGKAAIVTPGVGGDVSLWDVDNNVPVTPSSIVMLGVAGGANTIADTDTAGTISFVAATEQAISGARNYELRANITVTGAIAVGDYLQTRILNPSASFSQPNTYANAVAAKFAAANGWAYTTAGPVAAGHTRMQVADSFTPADALTVTTAVIASAATQSYGLNTGDTVIVNTGVGANLPTVTGTLVNAGYTCTVEGGKTNTVIAAGGTTFTVTCARTGGRIVLTYTIGAGANDWLTAGSAVTTTITKAIGALGTGGGAVGAADSDVGLTLSATMTPSFVWSDNSAALHSELTADWTTDYLVKNLPTNTQNLVK